MVSRSAALRDSIRRSIPVICIINASKVCMYIIESEASRRTFQRQSGRGSASIAIDTFTSICTYHT